MFIAYNAINATTILTPIIEQQKQEALNQSLQIACQSELEMFKNKYGNLGGLKPINKNMAI